MGAASTVHNIPVGRRVNILDPKYKTCTLMAKVIARESDNIIVTEDITGDIREIDTKEEKVIPLHGKLTFEQWLKACNIDLEVECYGFNAKEIQHIIRDKYELYCDIVSENEDLAM